MDCKTLREEANGSLPAEARGCFTGAVGHNISETADHEKSGKRRNEIKRTAIDSGTRTPLVLSNWKAARSAPGHRVCVSAGTGALRVSDGAVPVERRRRGRRFLRPVAADLFFVRRPSRFSDVCPDPWAGLDVSGRWGRFYGANCPSLAFERPNCSS